MPGVGSNPNWPQLRIWVNFANQGASSADPSPFYPTNANWVDITAYCRRIGPGQLMHSERGRNYERAQTDTGVLNFVLDNSTGAFDPGNAASPFYPNVKPIRKVQVTAVWGGTTYYLFHGRVEDWPRVWKSSGFWGEISATARGMLGSLSTINLNAAWVAAAISDGATAIYRCNDPSGSVTAANTSSTQQNYGVIMYTSDTTSASKYSFGSNQGTGNLAGDPTNSLTLDCNNGFEHGYYLSIVNNDRTSNLIFPVATGGWSWEGWVLPNAPDVNTQMIVMDQNAYAGGGVSVSCVLNNGSPNVQFSVFGGGAGFAALTINKSLNDGAWHHLVMTFASDAKTLNAYIDGVLVGTYVSSVALTAPTFPQDNVIIGMNIDSFSPIGGSPFIGSFKNLAWYLTTVLSPTQVLNHFRAGQGYVGDDTGTRIARLLAYAPYPYQALDVGSSTLGRMNVEGENVVQAIEKANDTEVGTIIERGDGYIVFKNRNSRRPSDVPKNVFGEAGAPYQEDFNIQQDPAQIFTDVRVARDTGITVLNRSTSAELDFYPRTLALESNDNTDTQTVGLSQYLLFQYKTARDRIPSLTVIPSANVSLWPVALGREIGDRVTVTRKNPGAPAYQQDFYIEKITHDVQVGEWKTTFMLSSSTFWDSTFILDDAIYGQLDSNGLGF